MESFASGDQAANVESTEAQAPTTEMSFKVGEREFTPEAAAKKIEHADNFIAQLKAEQEEMRKQLEEMKVAQSSSLKLEEALSKLQQQQATPSENTTPATVEANVESQEEVVKRILAEREKELTAKQQEELQKQTFAQVHEALASTYGKDNVQKVVTEKAQELGLSIETVDRMARDPEQSKVLMRLFDAGTTRQQAAPVGQINTAGLKPKQEQKPIGKMTAAEMAAYMKQLRQAN